MNQKNKYKKLIFFGAITIFIGAWFAGNVFIAEAKTAKVSRNYGHAWWVAEGGCTYNWDHYRRSNRWIASGNISVIHRVSRDNNSATINTGDEINFSYVPDNPYFTGWGGSWDTPYGAWCSNINSRCGGTWQRIDPVAGGYYGYVLWTAVKPAVSLTSSDNNVVNCSGMTCTAVSPGTATITANIGKTSVRIWSHILSGRGWWWPSEEGSYLHPDALYIHCEHPGNILDYANKNSMKLPATSMSWTVTVKNSAPKPTVDLKANNSDNPTINKGDNVTLTWTSENADTCTASGDWSGSKDLSGTESQGSISQTKTYTITCTGPGGSASDSVTINISYPEPTVDLKGNNSDNPTITEGDSLLLTWQSTDADTCTASGDWSGSKTTAGNETENNITANKTYTLTCTGPGGSASDSVNVTVLPPTPTCNASLAPVDPEKGDNFTLTVSSQHCSTANYTCTGSLSGFSGSIDCNGSKVLGPISGVGPGTCTIQETSPQGTTGSCTASTIRVKAKPWWKEILPW